MKALFLLMPALLFFVPLQAQEKKVKCEDAFKAFEQKVNEGNFDAAYTAMPQLRTDCRGYNENIYRYSALILTSKIEMAADAEEKKVLVNELSDVYSEYNKYYPLSDAAIKKAMLLYQNKLAPDEEIYALLDAAFINNKDSFIDYNAIETYFLLYLDKFNKKDSAITADDFVEKFGAVTNQLLLASEKLQKQADELIQKQEATLLNNNEKMEMNNSRSAIESLAAVGENIEILTLKYIGCKNFEDYYARNYNNNTENVMWLQAMVNTLLASKCYNSDVLKNGALALHALQPTSQSAFNLASISQRNNNPIKSASYFEEAAQLEQNQKKKADLYYRAAIMLRLSDKAAAKKYALLSAQHNPKDGKPYLFLAEMYSSSARDCGITPFEEKALIWLAIETVKKAETAEAKYKPTVASMIKSYSERLPSKKEVKEAGKRKGDKITYGCWINETVTIPNLKDL